MRWANVKDGVLAIVEISRSFSKVLKVVCIMAPIQISSPKCIFGLTKDRNELHGFYTRLPVSGLKGCISLGTSASNEGDSVVHPLDRILGLGQERSHAQSILMDLSKRLETSNYSATEKPPGPLCTNFCGKDELNTDDQS
ncbi:hypothetical protein MSAN_01609900 [Mycena sanguinolenta]|uniref:Uncharacterized protein n=1 Tax=Mycena sanguinolenta TaxID=230812 RepID=A0A8H6Y0H3_9AGAR|nr:hypothetical protein MSAN_01609900 [Mycena sanguinolenta]